MDRPEHLDRQERSDSTDRLDSPDRSDSTGSLDSPDSPDRDFLDEFEAGQLAIEFDGESPEAVIEWALDRWGRRAGICTSFQAEGMVLLDMAWQIDPNIHVFTVDTGRLHQETYDFIDRVRDHYDIDIQVYFPDLLQVENMVGAHGMNLFYKSVESRFKCCNVRKVEPIRRALEGWMVGSPDCVATSGPAGRTSARSKSTTTMADSRKSVPWPTGPRKKSGTTSSSTTFRSTPCMRKAIPALAACLAHGSQNPARTRARDAGGGRRTRPRNAACTARWRPVASSTRWKRWWPRRQKNEQLGDRYQVRDDRYQVLGHSRVRGGRE